MGLNRKRSYSKTLMDDTTTTTESFSKQNKLEFSGYV